MHYEGASDALSGLGAKTLGPGCPGLPLIFQSMASVLQAPPTPKGHPHFSLLMFCPAQHRNKVKNCPGMQPPEPWSVFFIKL